LKGHKSRLRGQQAEEDAKQYLLRKGLTFVDQNVHCRFGEIDLVMRNGNEIVFVEVKYRSKSSHGSAAEFFDWHKRKKVEKAIAFYMHQHKLNPAMVPHRLDVIAIDNERIDWIKQV
jgi:putative endonuclease